MTIKPIQLSYLLLIFLLVNNLFANSKNSKTSNQKIKIACVGDSITYGMGVHNRKNFSYPAQLQKFLGEDYIVKNFGFSGATAIKKIEDRSYRNKEVYQQSKKINPDIVLLKLGTNDANEKFTSSFENFYEDYLDLVKTYKALPSKPRVIIILPIATFLNQFKVTLTNKVIPLIQKVAYETNSEIIDFHTIFQDRKKFFPDGLHPNIFAVEEMALIVYSYLKKEIVEFDITNKINVNKKSNFYGYQKLDFTFDKKSCSIIKPFKSAKNLPWVLRANPINTKSQIDNQIDIMLLEKGYHIAYLDIKDILISSEVIQRWNSFYQFLVKKGLSKKATIEATQLGSFAALKWATRNPKKISSIYFDTPILDFKNQKLIEISKETYSKNNFLYHSLQKLQSLAKAKVPFFIFNRINHNNIFAEKNAQVLIEKYKQLNGKVKTIKECKQLKGYSIDDLRKITSFILRQDNNYFNPSRFARESVEYRSGSAGWTGTWQQEFQKLNQISSKGNINLLFLGDSISQSWTGSIKRKSTKKGKRIFDKSFSQYNAATYGISGDRTDHILYRIKNGNLKGIDPKIIVLMIGVNNLLRGYQGIDTAEGIIEIVKTIREIKPNSKILLLGCFPTGKNPNSKIRKEVNILHQQIQHLNDNQFIFYYDMRPYFLQENGKLNYKFMSRDNVHLNGNGYSLWAEKLLPKIKMLMGI